MNHNCKHNIMSFHSLYCVYKLHLSHHGGEGKVYICILNGHYFFISPHIIQNFFKHPPLNQRKKLQPQPAVLIRKIKYRRCKAPPIVQRCIYYKELEFEFFDARGRSTRMPCSSLNEKITQKCRVVLFAQSYWDTIDHQWVHVYSPEASRGYKLLSNNRFWKKRNSKLYNL